MILKPLKCPACGANLYSPDPDAICGRVITKCKYRRSNVLIDFTNGEDGARVMQEATARAPEELNDWSEFWGEILDKGNYYDKDEVKNGDRTI